MSYVVVTCRRCRRRIEIERGVSVVYVDGLAHHPACAAPGVEPPAGAVQLALDLPAPEREAERGVT